MEFNEKRIIELFAGLSFVALLMIISLLVIYLPQNLGKSVSSGQAIVQDSYNVNSYNDYVSAVPDRTKDRGDYYVRSYSKNLRYSSYGEHIQEKGFFDNYRDQFNVYVVNKDYEGGYFRVKFYFCDYYDHCFSESVEKYVKAKEEVKFSYYDVQGEKYKYNSWEYDVISPEK